MNYSKKSHFETLFKHILVLTRDEYLQLKDTPKITYASIDGNKHQIEEGFITALVKEEKFYNYFLEMIEKKIPFLKCCYLNNTNSDLKNIYFIDSENIQIQDIANCTEAIKILKESSKLTSIEKIRLSNLEEKCSINSYVNKEKNKSYKVTIDGRNVEVDVFKMLKILFLEKNFKEVFNQD